MPLKFKNCYSHASKLIHITFNASLSRSSKLILFWILSSCMHVASMQPVIKLYPCFQYQLLTSKSGVRKPKMFFRSSQSLFKTFSKKKSEKCFWWRIIIIFLVGAVLSWFSIFLTTMQYAAGTGDKNRTQKVDMWKCYKVKQTARFVIFLWPRLSSFLNNTVCLIKNQTDSVGFLEINDDIQQKGKNSQWSKNRGFGCWKIKKVEIWN